MNRKGFMMAEVVVVSAVVMIAITGLYASYNKIYSIYNTRVKYYDTDTLYRLAYYRDFLIENTDDSEMKLLNSYINEATTDKISVISDKNLENLIPSDKIETVFLVFEPNTNLKSDNFDGIKPTFTDYISFLSTSKTFDANYLMIIEACENDDVCKYSYLEVYNEE